jgi:NADPH-dependent curcumin reductase CurA
MRQVLAKSLTIRGFIQREFADQRPIFYREMAGWIESGQVKTSFSTSSRAILHRIPSAEMAT